MKSIKLFILALCLFTCGFANAQKKKLVEISLTPEKWNFESQKVAFENIDGRQVMKLLPGSGKVVLRDVDFSTGTIEFDIQPVAKMFASMYFKYQDTNESECFYFRTSSAGIPNAPNAVQYAPYLSGVNLWDVMGHYQTNASFQQNEWNHVKLEVSQSQMRVYVNSEVRPTLEVPRLEGNASHGTIAFEGELLVSNLTINHADVAGLAHSPGIDPTDYDPRYIRKWKVSESIATPEKVDFSYEFLPTTFTKWENIDAERRGLINLTRQFGNSESRRLVWLKVVIKSDKEQTRTVDLGFSDEVWVFLNGPMVYLDKNLFNQPMMKEPKGRISIENASFDLPLIEGYNDLLIGVANDFYGWGIIARLDNLDGIELIRDDNFYYYGRKVVTLDEEVMKKYFGNYKQPNGKSVFLTKEENGLKFSGDDLPTLMFFPEAEGKFFVKEFNVQLELIEDKDNNIDKMRIFENGNEVLVLDVEKE